MPEFDYDKTKHKKTPKIKLSTNNFKPVRNLFCVVCCKIQPFQYIAKKVHSECRVCGNTYKKYEKKS